MRGALSTLLLVLLIGGGLFLWWQREAGPDGGPGEPTATPEQTADAVRSAEEKLSRLALDLEEAWLSAEEVNALLEHRPEVFSFGVLDNPRVEMGGDTLRVQGAVLVEELPSLPELDSFRPLLPDTASFDIEGRLLATTTGVSYLEIGSLEIARMPIPERFYAIVLNGLRKDGDSAVPPDALELPLPAAVGSARVEAGMLVLTP